MTAPDPSIYTGVWIKEAKIQSQFLCLMAVRLSGAQALPSCDMKSDHASAHGYEDQPSGYPKGPPGNTHPIITLPLLILLPACTPGR